MNAGVPVGYNHKTRYVEIDCIDSFDPCDAETATLEEGS